MVNAARLRAECAGTESRTSAREQGLGAIGDCPGRSDGAMRNLEAKLTVVMALLALRPRGDRSLLASMGVPGDLHGRIGSHYARSHQDGPGSSKTTDERRSDGGEASRAQKVIMLCTSTGFMALLVVPAFDHRFAWSAVELGGVVAGDVLVAIGVLSHLPRVSREHVHVGEHRSRRESKGHLDRAVRAGSPSDVCECVAVSSRHAARARLVLGACAGGRNDAISHMADPRRGTLPRRGTWPNIPTTRNEFSIALCHSCGSRGRCP